MPEVNGHEWGLEDLFLRVMLFDALRIRQDVGSAFGLYLWYKASVTVEFTTGPGVGVGGVRGLLPITDRRIAQEFEQSGVHCPERDIWRWRQTLKEKGYVTWKRAPNGLLTFVRGIGKFPPEKWKPLPSWAAYLFEEVDPTCVSS